MVKSQFIFDFRAKNIKFVANAVFVNETVDRFTVTGGKPSTWLPPGVTCQAGIHLKLSLIDLPSRNLRPMVYSPLGSKTVNSLVDKNGICDKFNNFCAEIENKLTFDHQSLIFMLFA